MNAAGWGEQGLVFTSGANRLVGVAALPERHGGVGVLLMVGGPQYRVGSHRQFTLLARSLAAAGVPSLRFDFTGMGDSEGDPRPFNETRDDLWAAIDAFVNVADGVSRVVLWGLCDAASSAMMFAHDHPRVAGMVLLNPWVHGADYSPTVKLSHYYRPLLAARENWGRLLSGKIDLLPAAGEFLGSSARTVAGWFGASVGSPSRHLLVREMLDGLRQFQHGVLVILSEDDLTAREFSALVGAEPQWREVMSRSTIATHTVAGADHTFSRREWKDQVARLTVDWVGQVAG